MNWFRQKDFTGLRNSRRIKWQSNERTRIALSFQRHCTQKPECCQQSLTLHLSAPLKVTFIFSLAQCLSTTQQSTWLPTCPIPHIPQLLPGERIWPASVSIWKAQGRNQLASLGPVTSLYQSTDHEMSHLRIRQLLIWKRIKSLKNKNDHRE